MGGRDRGVREGEKTQNSEKMQKEVCPAAAGGCISLQRCELTNLTLPETVRQVWPQGGTRANVLAFVFMPWILSTENMLGEDPEGRGTTG